MRCEALEAVTTVNACGPCGEWRGKASAPCRILRYTCNAITAVCALFAHIPLWRIGLHKLLSRQSALLTRIMNLLAPLGPLCRRETSQLAVLATLQGAFGALLLARIELLLALRLQVVGLSLPVRRIGLCLRRRSRLALSRRTQLLLLLLLACGTQLLSLNVRRLLNMPLLLLNVTIDHRRRLMALRRRKIWPRNVRCRWTRDMWCRHLRPCDLRRGARCRNMRRGARCHLRNCRPRGRSRGSCRCRPWRSLRSTLPVSGILCRSCYWNGDSQGGGQRHSSTQLYHSSSSTSAELKFRHSTG
jgi:hypothetical protein